MTQDRFYVGVDGGGTKTLAVVVDDEGRERGRHATGSGNYQAVGLETAVENIRGAVEKATREAAGRDVRPVATWIGLAGVDRPADKEIMLPRLRELADSIHVSNDAELALSALDRAVGVAAVAGTGVIAVGSDGRRTARSGGWGAIIGDEGSGYDLGRRAAQAVARMEDGRGPATSLREAILRFWDIPDATGMLGKIYPARDTARLASLSGIVFEEARVGDRVARELVEYAAGEVALCVAAVAKRLELPGNRLPLALTGGILVNQPEFREAVLRRLAEGFELSQVEVVAEPALSGARAAIHLPVTD